MLKLAENNLLINTRYLASPHHNERPANSEINLLVIHNISLPPGKFGEHYIDDLFLGKLDVTKHPYFASIASLKVSAHAMINRVGEITQYVPFDKRAWHAGLSVWEGRENCNDYSIGVELEGTDDQPYTDAQYQSLISLTKLLMQHFSGIRKSRIVGHCDVAPGRKTDPGPAFDWQRFLAEV